MVPSIQHPVILESLPPLATEGIASVFYEDVVRLQLWSRSCVGHMSLPRIPNDYYTMDRGGHTAFYVSHRGC